MIIGVNDKGCDTFNTPEFVFKQLDNIFNFTVDAACSSKNKKTNRGFCWDLGIDGLKQSWRGERVFCNPPFSKKSLWINKAVDEVENNKCPVVIMILPVNCMSANSFYHKVIRGGYHYEVVNRRIGFLDDETKEPRPENNSGTVIVYFKKPISRDAL